MKRKILAIVMTFAMVVGLMPMMGAYAESDPISISLREASSGYNENYRDSYGTIEYSNDSGNNYSSLTGGVSKISSVEKQTGKIRITAGSTTYNKEPIISFEAKVYDESSKQYSETETELRTLDEFASEGYVSSETIKVGDNDRTRWTLDLSKINWTNVKAIMASDPNFNLCFGVNAVFLWYDSDEQKICKYYVLMDPYQNNVNYVCSADIIDTNDTESQEDDCQYTFGQDNAGWALASEYDKLSDVDKQKVDVVFGNGDTTHGIILNPCAAESGKNSICSFGDQNFKVTIYREGFRAVHFCDKKDDYDYFFSKWDATFFPSVIDVSESDFNEPATFTATIFNNTVKFKDEEGVSPDYLASVEIYKGEGYTDNEDAYVVTYNENTKEYTVTFKSNYYDEVPLLLTYKNSENQVIEQCALIIKREALDVTERQTDTLGNWIEAGFYYPTSKAYTDFDVYATIHYEDGTNELTKLEASKHYDEGSKTEEDKYFVTGGKNLYLTQYRIYQDNDKRIIDVDFNVTYKDAADTSDDNYKGSFIGSGRGINYVTKYAREE